MALLWAGWWTFFVFAVVLSEGSGLLDVMRHGFWFGPAALIVALIAVRWERIGGVLLIGAGVAWAFIYPLGFKASAATTVFMMLTLAAPPLAAGIMLLLRSRKAR